MNILTLYDCNLNRVRLGDKNDGGYVIFDGLVYDGFISGGIEYTNTFENEFIEKYNTMCYAFDNSIDELPQTNEKIMFKKNEINKTNNLTNYIDMFQNCFVKMDIEGSEWEWLSSLNTSTLNRISQLVIEFHFLLMIDDEVITDEALLLRAFMERLQTIKELNDTHVMCHIHANNFSQNMKFNGNTIPTVIECTFLNKKIFQENSSHLLFENIRNLPTIFDAPNCDKKEDTTTILNYPPFVNSQFKLIRI